MMQKLRSLIERYRDILTYLVFGVLTTVVNYAIYLPIFNFCGISAAVSNMIAWVGAVIFAFLTNKPFVFHSHNWSAKTVVPELMKFVSCRLASGVLETVILFLAVDCMDWNGNLWKLVTQVLVIVINYVASKLLVFRKK